MIKEFKFVKPQDRENILKTAKYTSREIQDGLNILKKIDQEFISIFGSHVTPENSKDYINCEKTAYLLGKKGYGIISGGGPGIMKAANSGATRAKTASLGFKAKFIQKEQHVDDKIFTHKYSFSFLFVRRYCLAVESKALIFYPGGYGTLNELFEYITLIETHMEEPTPVICVNKKYWKGLFDWLKNNALKEKYIQKSHLESISFADTPEEVLKIIQKSKK
ncbi:MAG: TIGR00730 family Rossman fold protein [Candidatus Nanoarchaeia archaeon]